jgi:NADH-quinone oxidoreductase subunit C
VELIGQMTKEELTAYFNENFSGDLEVIENDQPEPYIIVTADRIVDFARFLHDDPKLQMTFMMNLSAVDTTERMEIVYNVCSYRLKHRVYVKVIIDRDKPEIDSVMKVWPAADWYEREMWELFGINVRNHPNLTRFLLPDDWDQGHPMLKDWVGRDVEPLPERN